ncbi:MAG: hypothetical protein GX297_05715 [Treponema sp.]|nr:hypothetical protein [Treponema sp.]
MYKTEDGATYGFENWSKKDIDKLSELQAKWLCKTQGAPMFMILSAIYIRFLLM